MRRAISREWTPSPGPYSAITRGLVKSILLATRSTSALELGTIDAIWKGRFRKRLKNNVLTRVENVRLWASGCLVSISSVINHLISVRCLDSSLITDQL